MAKNVNAKRATNGWAAFLMNMDVRRGYHEAVTRQAWPKAPSEQYEWGRYLGAEVAVIEGEKAPLHITPMARITKSWQKRLRDCDAFQRLAAQHFRKIQYAA